MQVLSFSVLLVFLAREIKGQACTNGNRVLKLGTSSTGDELIVKMHNKYRLLIAHGKVHGQPQGTNLLRMSYDKDLELKARVVSLSCEMNHISISDPRWDFVGQNIYMEMSSVKDETQNWEAAVKAWFDEYEYYTYPGGFGMNTGHYTQVIWADTHKVGCDFIMFYDNAQSATPYIKLYTCNYGPGGNVQGETPYEVDDSSECMNLC